MTTKVGLAAALLVLFGNLAAAEDITNPVAHFLATRETRDALLVVRKDLNADSIPEYFITDSLSDDGAAGYIWQSYISNGKQSFHVASYLISFSPTATFLYEDNLGIVGPFLFTAISGGAGTVYGKAYSIRGSNIQEYFFGQLDMEDANWLSMLDPTDINVRLKLETIEKSEVKGDISGAQLHKASASQQPQAAEDRRTEPTSLSKYGRKQAEEDQYRWVICGLLVFAGAYAVRLSHRR